MVFKGSTRNPPPAQTTVMRPLNTAFQVDAVFGAFVSYSVQQTVTASIVAGQSGTASLQIASDQAFTQNVQTIAVAPGSQTYSLAVALQGVQNMACPLMGYVPPGMWAKIVTTNLIGTPAFSMLAGQESLML